MQDALDWTNLLQPIIRVALRCHESLELRLRSVYIHGITASPKSEMQIWSINSYIKN